MKKILIFGKGGQVGWECQRVFSTIGSVVALDYPEVDLCRTEEVGRIIRELRPNVIVNAAAYTAVDQAEAEYQRAYAINAMAPAIMAQEAKACGAALLTFSTDYVYDGRKQSPYVENDPECPINAYGRSKLAGDELVRQTGGSYIIFRTSWIYGSRGKNFLNTILRLARERSELRIVDDQIGCPTWSRLLAQVCAQVVLSSCPRGDDVEGALRDSSGVYHVTGRGETSWYGFAKEILERHSALSGSEIALKAIQTADYPVPARRPTYSVLSTARLERTFAISLPEWRETLHQVLDDMGVPNARKTVAL